MNAAERREQLSEIKRRMRELGLDPGTQDTPYDVALRKAADVQPASGHSWTVESKANKCPSEQATSDGKAPRELPAQEKRGGRP